MSESGERDGKKPTPRAKEVVSQVTRASAPHHTSGADADEFAGWDDTTVVHQPAPVDVDETTMVHHASELARAAQLADESHRPGALLPPKPPVDVPEPRFPPTPLPVPDLARELARPSARARPVPRFVQAARGETASSGFEMGRPIFAVSAVGVLAAAGAFIFTGRSVAVGVLIGAAIATSNLWAFTRLGRGLGGRRPVLWTLLAFTKLIVLFGGAFWVLTARLSAPLPFLVGYLALPVGIVLSQLLGLRSEFEDGEGSI